MLKSLPIFAFPSLRKGPPGCIAMRGLVILFFLMLASTAHTQSPSSVGDSIRHRIILIGDAGEMDRQQQAVIPDASSRIIPGKTTVLYLGDNVYPKGIALSGSKDEQKTQTILQSQYQPMRSKGATVYFVPGNHDWDKSGKNGLAKIKRQWQFLNEQHDSLVRLVPPDGCPDPVEINVSDSLTIIAFDSEWWLYPFSKMNISADCECRTKNEVLAKMEDILFRNRFKVIILASHHPFQSYGVHAGYFSWKDHLFPFTAINKNLYIPLPIVGSLYPLMRKTFVNPEDLHHPLYKDMIHSVDNVFAGFPNLVHVAGHEHGLQLIKGEQLQVVSGSGAKTTYARKKGHSLFADATQGYVVVDLLPSNTTRYTYYIYKDGKVEQAMPPYEQRFQDIKDLEEINYTSIKGDSIDIKAHEAYDKVSSFRRAVFGANYRKEWGATTRVPVLRVSELEGGLTPLKRGGGNQTVSLRLEDKNGKEWVLRSIEKYPERILPEAVRETFAKDVVTDAISSQHPYSALVVPVISNAVGVTYTTPVIGYVAPDKQLGAYEKLFANRLFLFEEREPLGNSDNTAKMLEKLNDDNDNSIDSTAFLTARLLDYFLGDWDRHEDQWRWLDEKKGSSKKYRPIPRDRDQALYKNHGFLPSIASSRAIAPFLKGFSPKIKLSNYFFHNGRNLDDRFLNQFDRERWMKITNDFVSKLTDSVLQASLERLPQSSYNLRHDDLLSRMKTRREMVPQAFEKYYRFLNKCADVRVSDKNELVEITDAPNGGLSLVIHKISKERKIKEQLFSKTFLPSETKEIRLFVARGDDSIVVNTKSAVKLRIVGGDGHKQYNIVKARKKIKVYEKENNASFTGMTNKLRKHLSDDTANLSIVPTNRINITIPLLSAGFNRDDGFIFGLGFRHIHQGFRKTPYASVNQLVAAHAFSTDAYRIVYRGEWLNAAGKADIMLQAIARAPDNTQNFFGRGNETVLDKTGDYKTYYRTRFALYQIDPAFRWRGDKGSSLIIGPSFQYYHYDADQNKGRFITNTSLIGSYDSSTIEKDKVHLGLIVHFISDKRNSKIIPKWGSYINVRIQGYAGMNDYSKSFIQINPEVALYKPLDARKTIILADRIGGGVSIGKTTFYQSQFIGGHENMFGYLQYRFAGVHSIYNNLELRIKLADFASYIVPGQFGLTTFFDVGRVWVENDASHLWHTGYGGGFYFSPAQMLVLQVVAGYSKEGWYPYLTIAFRF